MRESPADYEWPLLVRHLEEVKKGDDRFASSIVTRSEAELFGLSHPRFALRRSFASGGFVNLRRLKEFGRTARFVDATKLSLRPNLGYGARKEEDVEEHAPPEVAQLLADQSRIADCLLAPPARLPSAEFYFLGVPESLFRAYGEVEPLSNRRFTPYVKPFNFGGGLCAQSVAFMSTLLLLKYAKRACGLGEITVYAHEQNWAEPGGKGKVYGEIAISEMKRSELAAYFAHVELRMHEEVPGFEPDFPLPPALKSDVEAAIISYLRSGMPVIFPNSQSLLKYHPNRASSVYGQNKFILKEEPTVEGEDGHACVLVGFRRGTPEGHETRTFIIHDPSALPFMSITFEQLLNSGRSLSHERPDGTIAQRNDSGTLWPVVPAAVTLPLLQARPASQLASPRFGLLPILRTLLSFPYLREDLAGKECAEGLRPRDLRYSHFAVVDMRLIAGGATHPFDDLSLSREGSRQLNDAFKRVALKIRSESESWCWVEYDGTRLIFWRATAEPATTEMIDSAEASLAEQLFVAHELLA